MKEEDDSYERGYKEGHRDGSEWADRLTDELNRSTERIAQWVDWYKSAFKAGFRYGFERYELYAMWGKWITPKEESDIVNDCISRKQREATESQQSIRIH